MVGKDTSRTLGGVKPAGELFGNYRIQSLIGHGGFASVYKAEFQGEFGFRKSVALKVLRRRLSSLDEEVWGEFLNEARLGASIRHPNLVEFYECGRVGDRLYIAMEIIAGPNLAQVMRMIPDLVDPLDDSVILATAMQMARGLKGLHAATLDDKEIGAIHRDMKPGNILLSPEGQAKITDYGITRFAADFYQTLDQKGPRGSPLYMSPEQARGEALSQASDVFSFGSTVLEMITGTPVFAASSVMGIMDKVRSADVGEALVVARRRFPQTVRILEDCMVADPDHRITDGAALVEALKEVQPPAFGEELIGQLATHAYEVLQTYQDKRGRTPMLKFWSHLAGDSRDPDKGASSIGPSSVDEDEFPDVPRPIEELLGGTSAELSDPSEEDSADSPDAVETVTIYPDGTAEVPAVTPARPSILPWLVTTGALLLVIVVLAVVALPQLLGNGGQVTVPPEQPTEAPTPPDPETPTPPDDDGVAGTSDGTTDGGTTTPPTDPPTDEPVDGPLDEPVDEPATPVEPKDVVDVEPTDPVDKPTPTPAAGSGPPRLQHDPITRGIRGQDIRFKVSIDPPGSYRSTVWYRAAPDGAWQTRNVDGGEDGTLTVVIPSGIWLSQESSEVDYFIEVAGPGGLSRSGSAARPFRFKLF